MQIKICGIKNLSEAKDVTNLEIDYIGVIFAESIRRVDLKMANEIAKIAHKNGKKVVGVFAKFSDDEILEYVEHLDAAQIYDKISANLYQNLKSLNKEVWQVFSVSDALPNLGILNYDMALFDCKGKNLGGNGISFDWEILKSLKPFSFGLAGGLGVHNIDEAIKYSPKILDINSKVEDENGIKNPKLISKILKILQR
ncbi:phosphoribosylanthranilate isomerase [Campylobacter sp. FMV-PI01]|uniref:N-(5'-phosphoribosyl)anthranilate isomerase n=1 Tax=Campylobacter portucalensis TaxID=2608384 RepID=A0A6L5WI38_9BACT|nr:phosphoribosylanthranilate isomerase [Campylobacter portucalensis]MSN96928.1 phosphoribosylanthranilate isomerase [Campylobacter portucalensis]